MEDKFTEFSKMILIKKIKSRTESFRVEEIKQEKSNKLLNFTFITDTHQAGPIKAHFDVNFIMSLEIFSAAV